MTKKIGVILSGCGHLDGAEIRESVLTLLAIDKLGAEAVIMAPNKNQHHVVNHTQGEESTQARNVLEESARIARGEIQDLAEVGPDSLDALILPGGFGVAKNLSTLAFEGPKGSMDEQVKSFIQKIHQSNKPIGTICIAPAVICLALGEQSPEVTIGNDSATIEAIEAMGGVHHECAANSAHIDQNLKLVSTPAYMYGDARISEVACGIEECVRGVLKFLDE